MEDQAERMKAHRTAKRMSRDNRRLELGRLLKKRQTKDGITVAEFWLLSALKASLKKSLSPDFGQKTGDHLRLT